MLGSDPHFQVKDFLLINLVKKISEKLPGRFLDVTGVTGL